MNLTLDDRNMSSSSLNMSSNVCHVDKVIQSQLQGVTLNKSEGASECICLKVINSTPIPVSIGTYSVSWRRKTDESSPYVDTVFPLPTVNTEYSFISVCCLVIRMNSSTTCFLWWQVM
ncbi:trafficking protein particle complex subunit 11-like [Ostrea edulis]|uniref:trafficking protein particle complex subunit 11-like n=1 Tax=Ostrea edulis TaxID=37623 RepID=UPI0024AF5358|nr:trafficking protein particle complex subunit 11-like [Ostrea edulis]